jgi:hypothetical protein
MSASTSTSSTSRHRHPFRAHLNEDISDSDGETLDETQQDQLITTLSSKARKDDALYRLIFTLLPVASGLAVLFGLVFGGVAPGSQGRLARVMEGLLGLTSLGMSAWGMYSVDLPDRSISDRSTSGRDSSGRGSGRAGGGGSSGGLGRRPKPSDIFGTLSPSSSRGTLLDRLNTSFNITPNAEGPLAVYVPYLNILIAGFLALISISTFIRVGSREWVAAMLLLLPAVNLAVVSVVKSSMTEIEQGLGELRGLRYEYKGA